MEELAEWEAYHFFEPFGSPAEDDRWRQMYSLYYSANAKPGTEMPDWLDRDPDETARIRAANAKVATLEDKLMAFLDANAIDGDAIEERDIEQPS